MISTTVHNEKFETKLGVLINKIRDFNFVISGSFVISTILDETSGYESSDIDLYVGYDYRLIDGVTIDSEFDRWICEILGGILVRNKNYQDKSWKYLCPDFTLNIINTRKSTKEEIIQYIIDTSDLDICMSTYDGYNCRYFPSLLAKKAKITNSHLIETTFEYVGSENDREKSFKSFSDVFIIKRKTRQYKYITRGFDIEESSLSQFDEYKARCFIQSQNLKESSIRECLYFIANNVNFRSNITLSDLLNGKPLFPYKYEIPVICIHFLLTYENYSWALKWKNILN